MAKTKVIVCGFGQVGRMLYAYLKKQDDIEVAGIIDRDPAVAGKTVATLTGDAADLTLVCPSPEEWRGSADAAMVTTVSDGRECFDLMLELFKRKLSVVTSCEELFYPLDSKLAAEIDQAARQYDCAAVAGGINPGFLMDYLPSVLSGCSGNIRKIRVSRIQNAALRRLQFQKKIGAGLSPEKFNELKKAGSLRHVGLSESVSFLAAMLGWNLDEISETISPVISGCDYNIPGAIPVANGAVRGVHQTGSGFLGGVRVIQLEFIAAVGEPESYDRISIEGDPEIESTIRGGVNGDAGSCAVLTNILRAVAATGKCGFLNLSELPVIHGRGVAN